MHALQAASSGWKSLVERDFGLKSRGKKKPYVYEPLQAPDAIRILTLSTRSPEKLECCITQVRIMDQESKIQPHAQLPTSLEQPKYQALSYVWGNSKKPFKMFVRNKRGRHQGYIPLTASLHDALCDLRDSPGINPKTFWIDQISIDQAEKEEKGHQVAMMGSIYKNATRVIIYLGPEGPNDDEGIDLIKTLHAQFRGCYGLIAENKLNWAKAHPQALPERIEYSPNLHHDPAWSGMLDIVFGEWTRRLWMVQERVLATSLIMLRGRNALSWRSVGGVIMLTATCLIPPEVVLRYWSKYGTLASMVQLQLSLFLLWRFEYLPTHHTKGFEDRLNPLGANLGYYSPLECSDPRDRIYALLPISSDSEALQIAPDYQRTTSSLFAEVMIRILSLEKTLYPLLFMMDKCNPEDITLPSWAGYSSQSDRRGLIWQDFRSHPKEDCLICAEDSNKTLLVKGRVLDQIVASAKPRIIRYLLTYDEWDVQDLWEGITALSLIMMLLNRVGVTDEAVTSLHYVSGPYFSNDEQSPFVTATQAILHFYQLHKLRLELCRQKAAELAVDIAAEVARIENTLRTVYRLLSQAELPEEHIDEFDSPSLEDMRALFEDYDSDFQWRRPYCVTEQNRICNAMEQSRDGDVIALLQGSHIPVVLRPVDDKFRLIGDAWVSGIMHGEAYENVDPDDVDYEIKLI